MADTQTKTRPKRSRFAGGGIYPVTIFAARYGGIYEGGRYVAFNCDPCDIPESAWGNDVICYEFFNEYDDLIGRGETPDEALLDLVRQAQEEEQTE